MTYVLLLEKNQAKKMLVAKYRSRDTKQPQRLNTARMQINRVTTLMLYFYRELRFIMLHPQKTFQEFLHVPGLEFLISCLRESMHENMRFTS